MGLQTGIAVRQQEAIQITPDPARVVVEDAGMVVSDLLVAGGHVVELGRGVSPDFRRGDSVVAASHHHQEAGDQSQGNQKRQFAMHHRVPSKDRGDI